MISKAAVSLTGIFFSMDNPLMREKRTQFVNTIIKVMPYTPVRSAIWMTGKNLNWEYPRFSQGNPVKNQDLIYSEAVHNSGRVRVKESFKYL